jgi:hypothetical protein
MHGERRNGNVALPILSMQRFFATTERLSALPGAVHDPSSWCGNLAKLVFFADCDEGTFTARQLT